MNNQEPMVAGRQVAVTDEGTDRCLSMEERPPTPEGVRKYRKSYFSEAGQRVVHPGLIDDVKNLDLNAKYGKTTADSDHVENIFSHGPQTSFEEFKMANAEEVYASTKREPLGKSYSRGHALPGACQDPSFQYGVGTSVSEPSKNLIYPEDTSEKEEAKDLYIRSHGNYQPGQQRNRNYNWTSSNINPKEHVFGTTEKNRLRDGVSLCMDPRKDPAVPKTRITSKQVQDTKNLKDQLGRARNLGHGPRNLAPNHSFGVKGAVDDWDAAACIAGDYSVEEQMPDKDLGVSATPGWRNVTTDSRGFGTPTVRVDVSAPTKRSISDNQNYGDDVNAGSLIQPSQFSMAGVGDTDFIKERDQNTIRTLFVNIGYDLLNDDDIFSRIWDDAATNFDLNSDGIVSVEEFRCALNKYLDEQEDAN